MMKTDWKEDKLSLAMGGKRKYQIYENADGTVSFNDATEYDQVGDEFGASQLNEIGTEMNTMHSETQSAMEVARMSANSARESAERAMSATPEGYEQLVETVDSQNVHFATLELLGWTVPKEMPIQNEISNGKLIQKVGRVDLGSLEWKVLSDGSNRFYCSVSDRKGGSINSLFVDGYTLMLPNRDSITGSMQFSPHNNVTTNDNIVFRNDFISSVEDFKVSVTNKYIYYELKTPIEHSLYSESVTARAKVDRKGLELFGWIAPVINGVGDYIADGVYHKKISRVDLGSLNWYSVSGGFKAKINSYNPNNIDIVPKIYCLKYNAYSLRDLTYNQTKGMSIADHVTTVWIKDSSYSDINTFQSAMSGTYLYYELDTEQTVSIYNPNVLDTIGTTTNMIVPILKSNVTSGVTCTDLGDGTYSLSGTASEDAYFSVWYGSLSGKTIKMLGCPSGGGTNYYMYLKDSNNISHIDKGNGTIVDSVVSIYIYIKSGTNTNGLIFKPMLTTNLQATYDDFVPFTGSTGKLNSDVAELHNDIISKIFEFSTSQVAGTIGTRSITQAVYVYLEGYSVIAVTMKDFDSANTFWVPIIQSDNVVAMRGYRASSNASEFTTSIKVVYKKK